jgi:hypothetical protein
MTRKTLDYALNESFARLYCKEKGIKPDDCWSDYADMGNCNSYITVTWEVKGKRKEDQIEIKTAYDLLAKRILRIEESLVID